MNELSAIQINANYRAAVKLIWDAQVEITKECGNPANDAGFSKLCSASRYIEKQQCELLSESK